MAYLELRELRRSFGPVVALQGINIELGQGEFLSLLGPSGCGKTTALRLVAGFDRPDSGSIVVDGKDVTRVSPNKRDMGMVFQAYSLFPNMTAAQNVEFGLKIRGRKRGDRQGRVQELLELVGLGHAGDRYPWQLSGGMQQRVSIARALSFDPALLLMDEPFGALDEMTRERMNLELLRIWEASGSTIVFVTHSIAEAVFLSTRVVVMSPRPGRISDVIEIDLQQPRTAATREEPRFFELVTRVREALHLGSDLDRKLAAPAAEAQP
ncbi:MAG: ABC transporter ATP-binding protein [Actinobacteria bacterium]|nr:MAG: ABC transporter ATP-binding protein [Actinomycetota bacterium]